MTDFKKNRKFSADKRPGKFARPSSSRPHFGGSSAMRRPTSRPFDASTERYQATCNKCGDICEVPFRPNGKKPVYCRNCFVREDAQAEMRGFGKRGFDTERPAARLRFDASASQLQAIQKELTVVHAKLDALIERLDATA